MGQTESKPPVGGGTSNSTAIFLTGFGLGVVAGLLLGAAVCNKGGRELAMGAGSSPGIVAQASPDAGRAPPPRENAPAEKPPQ